MEINKLDLIRNLIDLYENSVLDSREVVMKIELILNKPLVEEEMPEILKKKTHIFKEKIEKASDFKEEMKEKYGTKKHTRRKFTPEDIKFIRNNYKKMSQREIARILGRSQSTIQGKVEKLKKVK